MSTLAVLFSAPSGIKSTSEMPLNWKPEPKTRAEILAIIAELFPGLSEFKDNAIYFNNSTIEIDLWQIGLKGIIVLQSGESLDSFVIRRYSEEVIKPLCKRLGWRATGGSSGDFIDNSF